MAKSIASVAPVILKDIRAALDSRSDEKARQAMTAAQPRSPLKTLGVRPAFIKTIAKDVATKHRASIDYAVAVALVDVAVSRKTREEILVALEILERFRREFEPTLLASLDKWSSLAEDAEVAEFLGARVAAPALALDPARMPMVRKWAKVKSVGKRRLAVLAASGLVTEGRREAAAVLDLCEILLHEETPLLVAGVASLLKDTTKVDAKAVQDFLFRRSIDGNPDILRAGSENLDAARRAALIAKLEAQAALTTTGAFAAAGR